MVLPEGVELPEGQRVEVRVAEPERRAQPHPGEDDEILQDLLESGLLSEIRPISRGPLEGDRRLAKVTGKPLSEHIIEQRR